MGHDLSIFLRIYSGYLHLNLSRLDVWWPCAMPEIESLPENHALFGKYELGRVLGCGAFAKVYFARNIQNGHSVAVKVISKKKICASNLMSNIKREITIMSRLNHPNIVKLHEVLATKTKIYFVMKLVKGSELFTVWPLVKEGRTQ